MASNKIKVDIKELPKGLIFEPCSFEISTNERESWVALKATGPIETLCDLVREPFAPKIFKS